MALISVIKENTPWPIRRFSRMVKLHIAQRRESARPPKEVFTEIYQNNIWGDRSKLGGDHPFYSGPGSLEEASVPYAKCINKFIADNDVKRIVDLGCGDFRVGRQIALPHLSYTGVDIVEPLIEANQRQFGNDHIQFRCLNMADDPLPDGDLVLVRQVFQHISNAQISKVLAKVKKFKWAIITEDLPGPAGTFKPNRDKPSGRASRIVFNSAVVLDAPPFNVKNVEFLMDVPAPQTEYRRHGRICSYLIRN